MIVFGLGKSLAGPKQNFVESRTLEVLNAVKRVPLDQWITDEWDCGWGVNGTRFSLIHNGITVYLSSVGGTLALTVKADHAVVRLLRVDMSQHRLSYEILLWCGRGRRPMSSAERALRRQYRRLSHKYVDQETRNAEMRAATERNEREASIARIIQQLRA